MDDTTLYSKCHRASYLWQQLELASELESDLRDTINWDRKWLFDFNAGKIQLVSFNCSNNTGAIDVKVDGSVLEENPSWVCSWEKSIFLRCWGCLSPLSWNGTLSLPLKLPPRKLSLDLLYEVSFSGECSIYLFHCLEYFCHVSAGIPS